MGNPEGGTRIRNEESTEKEKKEIINIWLETLKDHIDDNFRLINLIEIQLTPILSSPEITKMKDEKDEVDIKKYPGWDVPLINYFKDLFLKLRDTNDKMASIKKRIRISKL